MQKLEFLFEFLLLLLSELVIGVGWWVLFSKGGWAGT